jgi:hypothetical protein
MKHNEIKVLTFGKSATIKKLLSVTIFSKEREKESSLKLIVSKTVASIFWAKSGTLKMFFCSTMEELFISFLLVEENWMSQRLPEAIFEMVFNCGDDKRD